MFETLLEELKLARAAATDGKYFTGLSHGGKAITAAGDIGARFFETSNGVITFGAAGDCDEATLSAIEEECTQFHTVAAGPDTVGAAGWQDWFNAFLPIVLDIIKKIRELKK